MKSRKRPSNQQFAEIYWAPLRLYPYRFPATRRFSLHRRNDMWPNQTAAAPPSKSRKPAQRYLNLATRTAQSVLGLMTMLLVSAAAALGAPAERPRETVLKLVAQIQKADYEGNRVALQSLYADLEPFNADEKLASRVRYWRGFALWRRAINRFNDSADPKELEHDLTQALAEFKESSAKDPAFVDAKIGTISCLGNLMYLARGRADRVQELLAQSTPLVKEVRASHPRDYTFEDCFSGRLALRVHSIPKCCSNPKFHLDV